MIRVFPRKTNLTPTDKNAFVGFPPLQKYDKINISVTFSYDKSFAEEIADYCDFLGDVSIGGPAYGDPGGDFVPGLYLKHGSVFTSRGCPNNCWFCDVPKREGGIRELPITNGWNIMDSNILACSKKHFSNVCNMLKRQSQKAIFTGGLEAKRLTEWHVTKLWELRPGWMYFAYDTPDDLEPLIEAGKKMRYADFTRYHLRCFVLIGYPKDTFELAEKRLIQAWTAGFMPFAMLWKNKQGDENKKWRQFQRTWTRPAGLKAYIKDLYIKEKRTKSIKNEL